jgi:hypothetical protein
MKMESRRDLKNLGASCMSHSKPQRGRKNAALLPDIQFKSKHRRISCLSGEEHKRFAHESDDRDYSERKKTLLRQTFQARAWKGWRQATAAAFCILSSSTININSSFE